MKLLVHASVLMVFAVLMLGTIFTIDGARRWLRRRKHGPYWNARRALGRRAGRAWNE